MIDVKWLFDYVNENLAGYQGAGYTDVVMFNRDLAIAQNILYDFYRRGSLDGITSARLDTFTKTATAAVSAEGLITLPEDFREIRSVTARVYVSDCDTPFGPRRIVYKQVTAPEFDYYATDALLQPSFANRCAYLVADEGAYRVAPASQSGVTLRYYRNPVTPNLALTYTAADEAVVDVAATVNLEWPDKEADNFATLLAFQKGITDRESALIQYAQARMGSAQTAI